MEVDQGSAAVHPEIQPKKSIASKATSSVGAGSMVGSVATNDGTSGAGSRTSGVKKTMSKIKQYFFALVNFVLLVMLVYIFCLIASFMCGNSYMTAFQSTVVASGDMKTYPSSTAIGFVSFRDAGDLGDDVLLSPNGGTVMNFSTGVGWFNSVWDTNTNTFIVVGGQACSSSDGTSEGTLGATCAIPSGEVSGACTSVCVFRSNLNANAPSYSSDFVVDEYYRTKNSIGFGTTYVFEEINSVDINENSLTFNSEIFVEQRRNSKSRYLYWNNIVLVVLFVLLMLNIFTRFFVVPTLIVGLKGKASKIILKADLAGGVFTSPGISLVLWILLVVGGAQNFFFLEGSGYKLSWICTVYQAMMIASSVCVFLSYMFSRVQFACSGTVIVLISLIMRVALVSYSRSYAASEIFGLGEVLERTSTMLFKTGGNTIEEEVTTNIADGAGLSGLEIFAKVFMGNFLWTLLVVLGVELILYLIMYKHNAEQAKMYAIASKNSDRTLKRVGNYERVALLSGNGRSSFAGLMAKPVATRFGIYYHASTIVEDNMTFWGPLILSMEVHLFAIILSFIFGRRRAVGYLIALRWYRGVVVSATNMLSSRENEGDWPEYLEEFDFDNMNLFFNPTIIQ